MVGIIASWLVLSVAVWVAATVLDGVRIDGVGSIIMVAALFGIMNTLLGGIFFWVIGIATLGIGLLLAFLTRWLVDAILLTLVDKFTDRIHIDGFKNAFLAALIMAFIGSVGEGVLNVMGVMG